MVEFGEPVEIGGLRSSPEICSTATGTEFISIPISIAGEIPRVAAEFGNRKGAYRVLPLAGFFISETDGKDRHVSSKVASPKKIQNDDCQPSSSRDRFAAALLRMLAIAIALVSLWKERCGPGGRQLAKQPSRRWRSQK